MEFCAKIPFVFGVACAIILCTSDFGTPLCSGMKTYRNWHAVNNMVDELSISESNSGKYNIQSHHACNR